MEKNKPHYPLPLVKEMIQEGRFHMTKTATFTSAALDFTEEAVAEELLALERTEFYKSMTAYNDHKVWQDVYRHRSAAGMLYVKFSIFEDVLVLSFKELEK
ncbi:MAG: type II toxin-antitoxin system MqsR family toxin [Bilophila sp.]